MLFNCQNCTNCVGCINLRGQTFAWLNSPVSKDEYKSRIAALQNNPLLLEELQREFEALKLNEFHPWAKHTMCENCTGDYLFECRNCFDCYDGKNCEDCAHSQFIVDLKSSMDVTFFGLPGELLYECNNVGLNSYHCLFSSYSYGCRDIFYSYNTHYCSDCFGCVSLKQKKHCILNKQYSPEGYEKLCAAIVSHMQKTGEWGEFFPSNLSPFCYNETVAQDYFPIGKAEALNLGLSWKDEEKTAIDPSNSVPARELPYSIKEISDDILKQALICETDGRPYRILKAELDFYRFSGLPIPRRHPDIRHQNRMSKRNPRRLFARPCEKCNKQILSTYAPERKEKVLCEEDYLKHVYT